ncbi:DUF7848 domain-containing protein [Streptomyces huiliensis]|uniref:DUF7848 domain-containing protein n=1 Tax=Streptomyces huiliensis TaxID=2876027 RepID=UPI001CBA7A61|nr:hypothetical protein [Streptomyces huiliensis]MBZ4322523.1 hypothetical protein [Streptomyces huiliensis]
MTPRLRLLVANWALRLLTGEGVPDAIYSMECMTCGAQSEATDNDAGPAQEWTLSHTGRDPQCRVFKLHAETYWRTEPCQDNPYADIGLRGQPFGAPR